MSNQGETLTTEPTLEEVNRARRGHRFYPSGAELAEVPRIYQTDDTDLAQKVLHLHYFGGPADWWLAEYDPESGLGFGYACLGDPDCAEWGYVDLKELEPVSVGLVIVERDVHWTPCTVEAANLPGQAVR
jgi:hypothetical protein